MDSLQYYKIPAAAATYPKPAVPMLPVFSLRQLSVGKPAVSPFQLQNTARLSGGRAAILHALQNCGVTSDDTVLLPAYHCMSMIEPVVWLGAKIKFYPLTTALEPDFAALANLLTNPVKVVLIPHYFGFMQNIQHWYSLFNQRGITVIEDCAHAFFGERNGVRAGDTGDYAVCSTVKFFPGTEGGILRSKQPLRVQPRHRNWLLQLKALKNIVETAGSRQPLHLKNSSDSSEQISTADEFAILNREKLTYLEPHKKDWSLSLADSWVVNHSDYQQIVALRQQHYRYLAAALKNLRHCQVLFPELPDGCVPYVLPLLLRNPQRHFAQLKRAGVPLLRWEELVVNDCPVSNDYRLKLVQLPVHQTLNQAELKWLVLQLQQILDSE